MSIGCSNEEISIERDKTLHFDKKIKNVECESSKYLIVSIRNKYMVYENDVLIYEVKIPSRIISDDSTLFYYYNECILSDTPPDPSGYPF